MDVTWDRSDQGVLELPSGRMIRGRLLGSKESNDLLPSFGVYLTLRRPDSVPWDVRWLRWPDFWLPLDRRAAAAILREAWSRSESERVEVACPHGRGRTGTALACLAVLDGIPRDQAVGYVREHYSRHAVETPWQRRFVRSFPATSLDEFRN
jgi:protein-tyrosine phosphatase